MLLRQPRRWNHYANAPQCYVIVHCLSCSIQHTWYLIVLTGLRVYIERLNLLSVCYVGVFRLYVDQLRDIVFTFGKYGVFGLLLSNLFNDTLSNAVFYGPVRYRRLCIVGM